jgi:hypothetical protein
VPKSHICYLKATDACVKRSFFIPQGDSWVYAANSSLLVVICGDCKEFIIAQKQKAARVVPQVPIVSA